VLSNATATATIVVQGTVLQCNAHSCPLPSQRLIVILCLLSLPFSFLAIIVINVHMVIVVVVMSSLFIVFVVVIVIIITSKANELHCRHQNEEATTQIEPCHPVGWVQEVFGRSI
jgi:hypothetical protein